MMRRSRNYPNSSPEGQIGIIEFAIEEALKRTFDNPNEYYLKTDVQTIRENIKEAFYKKFGHTHIAGWRETGIT